jgi:hypothetical protein
VSRAFTEARSLLTQRLKNRAEWYWRKAAKEQGRQRRCLLRLGREAQECAEIAEALAPSHSPPDEPDVAMGERARSRANARRE